MIGNVVKGEKRARVTREERLPRQVPDILAGGEEEGADAEVRLAVLVDGLTGDGTLADGLHIAHLAVGLHRRLGEIFPRSLDDRGKLFL